VNGAERFRLLGTYKTPQFRYGRQVFCELRGWVTIVGLTEAPIPWPVGKRGRGKTLILYGDLEKAVRRESAVAVAHWWGVSPQTVTKWRRALDVGRATEGTSRLHRAYAAEPWARRAREQLAASKRGKPRPAHVIEAVRNARLGTSHSAQTRRKIGEAHRRRGTRPPAAGRPWTAEEDALLNLLTPAEVAERTGRTLTAVWHRRQALGFPDGRAGRKVSRKGRGVASLPGNSEAVAPGNPQSQ
jgi:hypothetical protein